MSCKISFSSSATVFAAALAASLQPSSTSRMRCEERLKIKDQLGLGSSKIKDRSQNHIENGTRLRSVGGSTVTTVYKNVSNRVWFAQWSGRSETREIVGKCVETQRNFQGDDWWGWSLIFDLCLIFQNLFLAGNRGDGHRRLARASSESKLSGGTKDQTTQEFEMKRCTHNLIWFWNISQFT